MEPLAAAVAASWAAVVCFERSKLRGGSDARCFDSDEVKDSDPRSCGDGNAAAGERAALGGGEGKCRRGDCAGRGGEGTARAGEGI